MRIARTLPDIAIVCVDGNSRKTLALRSFLGQFCTAHERLNLEVVTALFVRPFQRFIESDRQGRSIGNPVSKCEFLRNWQSNNTSQAEHLLVVVITCDEQTLLLGLHFHL